jgi:hypothetical protein
MIPARIAIMGHIGVLARAVAKILAERGHRVSTMEAAGLSDEPVSEKPLRVLYFPFSPLMGRRAFAR